MLFFSTQGACSFDLHDQESAMARAKRGRKSQAIREYLSENPTAMPAEVVAALGKRRIKVSSQMVSTLKNKIASGKGRAARAPNGMVSIGDLIEAKKLAQKLGSLEKVRSAIAALAKLS
jgi:hypothetical protein